MRKLIIFLIIHCSLFTIHCQAQTWKQLNSGTNAALLSVYFTSADTGYAVGVGGTIIKTVDGGENWIELYSGVNGWFNSVFFTDSKTGYIAASDLQKAGLILKTTNSGSTWIIKDSITLIGITSIYFPDKNTGYAVDGGGGILKTTDNGINWIELNYNKQRVGDLKSVYFTDLNTGFAVGDDASTDYGIIVSTTDGGINWIIQDSVALGMFTSVFFPVKDTGYILDPFMGLVLKTVNGGNKWNAVSGQGFEKCFFIDSNTGYEIGGGGSIFKTSDGGFNWVYQSLGRDIYLYDVFFPNKHTGYIVGENGTILKFSDSIVETVNFSKTNYEIVVSPNPTRHLLNIKLFSFCKEHVLVKFYDLTGREISIPMSEKKQKCEFDINCNVLKLQKGIYFIKITLEDNTIVRKIIKE